MVTFVRRYADALTPRFVSALVQLNAVFARLGPRGERLLAVGFVLAVHAVLLTVLIFGMTPIAKADREVAIVLVGGPLGEPATTQKSLDLAQPELEDAPPPTIDIVTPNAITPDRAIVSGLPNVTRPAMALAESHAFPPLPLSYPGRGAVVQLVITIARDGAIASAAVAKSCGSEALDRLALDWVKSHWRYQPALESGEAVAATTTAIVSFTPSG